MDGIRGFLSLGVLDLANNSITWPETGKLRHMIVCSLALHGNAELERSTYCTLTLLLARFTTLTVYALCFAYLITHGNFANLIQI